MVMFLQFFGVKWNRRWNHQSQLNQIFDRHMSFWLITQPCLGSQPLENRKTPSKFTFRLRLGGISPQESPAEVTPDRSGDRLPKFSVPWKTWMFRGASLHSQATPPKILFLKGFFQKWKLWIPTHPKNDLSTTKKRVSTKLTLSFFFLKDTEKTNQNTTHGHGTFCFFFLNSSCEDLGSPTRISGEVFVCRQIVSSLDVFLLGLLGAMVIGSMGYFSSTF